MKTIEAYQAFQVLKEIKMNDVDSELLSKLWHNLMELQPIANSLTKSEELLRNTLQDDKFREMVNKANRIQAEPSKYSEEEQKAVADYLSEHGKKGEKEFKKLHDNDVKLEIKMLKQGDVIKLMKDNSRSLGDMASLKIMIE